MYSQLRKALASKVQPVIKLGFHSSSAEVCERNGESGASVSLDLTTRFAKKLVVEPLATVDLGLNSAATHDVSHDSRDRTATGLTGEMSVTSCGWRLACESASPRIRYQQGRSSRRRSRSRRRMSVAAVARLRVTQWDSLWDASPIAA